VHTRDYLSDLTDELEEFGSGSYIEEFVSGGPKTYACMVTSMRPASSGHELLTL